MLPSMIPSVLKDFDYYKRKLPLWLQNSPCFVEHFRIWFDLLVGDGEFSGTSTTNDVIENLLNIFDPDYLTYVAQFDGSGADLSQNYYGNVSDVLDKVGALLGVSRQFQVSYTYNDVPVVENISLDNYDFLVLIKAQIVKNYCEGTQQQIQQYYGDCGLTLFVTTGSIGATCDLVLDTTSLEFLPQSEQDNIVHMFLSGLLTIDCVGISYTYTLVNNVGSLLVWDRIAWDQGVWAA